MKNNPLKSLAACCGLSLSLFGATLAGDAADNLLANPSFESGIAGWTGYWNWAVDSTNVLVYQSTAYTPSHSGSNVFKTWGGYNGGETYCGAYQDVPAAPGSEWAADCWAQTHSDDKMKGQNQCWLEVSFRSSDDPTMSLQTYLSPMMDSTTPGSTWTNLVVNDGAEGTKLVAPAGTSFVRVQIVFKQYPVNYDGGSAYLDDVKLLKTSAPDPEITVQPAPQTKVHGQTVSFNVVANGKTALSYSWRKDALPLSNGGKISGANTATLTLAGIASADQGAYSVVVTDAAGSLTSNDAMLWVQDPGIITQPVGLTRVVGETASFTVTGGASLPLTYVWNKDGSALTDGGRISGATTPTLTITSLQPSDAGSYTVVLTAGVNALGSDPAVLAVKTAAELANRLENPGFEATMDFWTGFGGNVIEEALPARTGTKMAKTFGNGTWNGIYQDVPAAAGDIFTADAWFRTETSDRITAANECWLELQFMNASGNMIGLYKSPYILATTTPDTWHYLQATNIIAFWGDWSVAGTSKYLVAPAGTATARYQVTYHLVDGLGSVFVDDMRLMAKLPVTVNTSVAGTTLTLSFLTQGATSYRVLYKNNLTDADWLVLASIEGDGSTKSATDTITGTSRFYRVEVE